MKSNILISMLAMAVTAAIACEKEPAPGSVVKDFSVSISLPDGAIKDSWQSGDAVKLVSQDGKAAPSTAVLTTSGSSSSTASFSGSQVTAGSEYWAVYPSGAVVIASSTSVYGIVPVKQKASAAGFDDDACLLAGAGKSSISLSPATAYVSLSISPELEEKVTNITLTSTEYIAGDVRISGFGGALTVASDETRNRAGQKKTIELEAQGGEFSSGVNYVFNVLPSPEATYTLSFRSEDGREWTYARSASALEPGQTYDFGVVEPDFSEALSDFVPIFKATKEGISPIVLVFAPSAFVDGTGAGKRSDFESASRAAAEYIFEVEPFKHFKEYFSVYMTWRAADSMDISQPWGVKVHTDANGNNSFNSFDHKELYDWIQERCPEVKKGKSPLDNVGVIMLVYQDNKYMGAVCDWESNGRFVALVDYSPNIQYTGLPKGYVPQSYGACGNGKKEGGEDGSIIALTDEDLQEMGYTTKYGSSYMYPSDYRGTALHEGMGHGFTRLMDEYWIYDSYTFPNGSWYTDFTTTYYNMTFPTGLNLSPDKNSPPWKALIDMKDELVAKDARYERIGSFQGGLVQYMWGIWRPERVSVMMDCRPYFSTWQRALAWQRIMRLSGEKPNCNVWKNTDDLRTYMDIDVRIGGAYDPTRDSE